MGQKQRMLSVHFPEAGAVTRQTSMPKSEMKSVRLPLTPFILAERGHADGGCMNRINIPTYLQALLSGGFFLHERNQLAGASCAGGGSRTLIRERTHLP